MHAYLMHMLPVDMEEGSGLYFGAEFGQVDYRLLELPAELWATVMASSER